MVSPGHEEEVAPAPIPQDLEPPGEARGVGVGREELDPAEMGGWLKLLAAEPNHVGSVHDKTNAEWIAAQLKSWGWDARIETFDVLYPTPISVNLELVGGPGAPFGGNWTYEVAAVPGGSRVTVTERGWIGNPLFRFMARFFFGYTATIDTYLRSLGKKFGETVEIGGTGG